MAGVRPTRNAERPKSPIGLHSMEIAWSRWLLGAWAAAAVAWLAIAILLLVQTWPAPSVGDDRQMLWGEADYERMAGKTMRGHTGLPTSSVEREHLARFVLYAVIPPG